MLIISSCSNTNPHQFTYFKDVPDTATYFEISDTAFMEPAIKPDDVLLINISSPNPEATTFLQRLVLRLRLLQIPARLLPRLILTALI